MWDPKDIKGKCQYHSWFEHVHKLLLMLLVEAINQGFCDANGKFNKLMVESRILTILQQQLGSTKTYGHYKIGWRSWSLVPKPCSFYCCRSGFGWNSETKRKTEQMMKYWMCIYMWMWNWRDKDDNKTLQLDRMQWDWVILTGLSIWRKREDKW